MGSEMCIRDRDPTTWLVALGWAVALPVFGLIFFWRGEGTYGRG